VPRLFAPEASIARPNLRVVRQLRSCEPRVLVCDLRSRYRGPE